MDTMLRSAVGLGLRRSAPATALSLAPLAAAATVASRVLFSSVPASRAGKRIEEASREADRPGVPAAKVEDDRACLLRPAAQTREPDEVSPEQEFDTDAYEADDSSADDSSTSEQGYSFPGYSFTGGSYFGISSKKGSS